MLDFAKLDKDLFLAVPRPEGGPLEIFFNLVSDSGSLFFLLAAGFLSVLLFSRTRPYVKFSFFTLPLIAADLGVGWLKLVFARPRPFSMLSSYSFPSGHAALAFLAAVLFNTLTGGRTPWIYAWALLVALSRVFLGYHYPSDVIGGALLGLALGLILRAGYRHFHLEE